MAGVLHHQTLALLLAASAWGKAAEAADGTPQDAHPGAETRLTRLALDIQRYRHTSGLRVVLNPERSAITVALCMSFPNQARSLAKDDVETARLLQLARQDNLGLTPAAARQLAWRGLSQQSEIAWDLVSFCSIVPAHDLEFGVWSLARQSQNSVPRALSELQARLLEERHGPSRVLDWLRMGDTSEGDEHAPSATRGAQPAPRVRALAQHFWQHEGAVLSLSGNFDTDRARGFIERHFVAQAASRTQAPRTTPAAGASARHRRRTWPAARSVVFLGFAIPGIEADDHPALGVLARVLAAPAGPHGWRAGSELSEVRAFTGDTRGSDLLAVEIPISSPDQVADAERHLLTRIARIAKLGPSQAQISWALAGARSDFWQHLESPRDRALVFAQTEARRGDARLALRNLSQKERVRSEDVARVAAKYLAAQTPAVLVTTPGGPE